MPLRLLLAAMPMAAMGSAGPLPTDARQAVVVTASTWKSPQATLQRWDRPTSRAQWRKVGDAAPALIGRNGLAWGLGLHKPALDGPNKREGDNCAPAGVFRFGTTFKRTKAPPLRWPTMDVTTGIVAVDDPASRHYNRFVDVRRRGVVRDWRSAEDMASLAGYDLGIWVGHNPKCVSGAGSCIFIHEWRGPRKGTAGCTVLRRPALEELLQWLDPEKRPVLVQLPSAEMSSAFTGATTTRKP
jgi:L,D-peptidoglycan transpeptidase YkuD (ErfK/YbiS/YcfS/YnhG family)